MDARGGFGGGKKGQFSPEGILQQIPQWLAPFYLPYVYQGQAQLPGLASQFGQMTGDPTDFYRRMAAGYQTSPGYEWRQKQGQEAALNAMAAGGMAGSPEHQTYAAETSENIANQDFENYMNRVLGIYGTGLQGQLGLGKMGLEAGGEFGTSIGNMFGGLAQMGWQRELQKQLQKAQEQHDKWGGIGSAIGGIGGGILPSIGKWLFGG